MELNVKSAISHIRSIFLAFALIAQVLPVIACGQDDKNPPTPDPKEPIVQAASSEGLDAISQFKYPSNLKIELYAAEPDVANIVAFHRDYQGKMFVCESFRQEKGVEDNRKHAHWMDEELAAQTVQDRIDYIRKYIPDADTSYTENDDRIKLLEDTDGDGIADTSKVFSNKYNAIEMGTGAGVLSYRDKVYYTCIPDLFELQDKDNDGVAEIRKSLHTGYGVRFAFRGHDMHGLIVGPDGRLYFSIGDRGYNISPKIKDPASGAVFRCELDGSNLEVVCTGLRNPQELAFNEYGYLFTCDNNSDSGDKARWTELVEGGDSGWRMYYQYMTDRGPFNQESIWHPFNPDSPAYIIPPIENFSDGPSGLEYYPGTGFGEEFNGRFFLCDFRGDASRSGVRSFRSVPDGAFWKLEDDEQPLWNMLVTDIDFGSDGRLYASDWVFGWRGENKGRMYTFHDPTLINSSVVKQVEQLLREGLSKESTEALETLLSHADQRVRQEAQFELVARGDVKTLSDVAAKSEQSQLARIHAIWGLSQLARAAKKAGKDFDISFADSLMIDSDPQVVAAIASVAGELGCEGFQLAKLLTHENLRVRCNAAMSLGHVGTDAELDAVVKMLVENEDKDPMVRHGGIMAIKGIFERHQAPGSSPVTKLMLHESKSVQLATVVAMRKTIQSRIDNRFGHNDVASKTLASMLGSSKPKVVLEAARAIYDLPVDSAMPTLAALIEKVDTFADNDPVVRRVVGANVRLGVQASAKRLAKFACNSKVSSARRAEAVEALANWAAPSSNDILLHDWRPLDPKKRNVLDAQNAVQNSFTVLSVAKGAVSNAAILAAGKLGIKGIGNELEQVIWSTEKEDTIRAAALSSFAQLPDVPAATTKTVVQRLIEDFDSLPETLAGQAVAMVAPNDSAAGLELIKKVMNNGKQQTQQMALAELGNLRTIESNEYLISLLGKMKSDTKFASNLRLDVVMAARDRAENDIKAAYESYMESITKPNEKASVFFDSLVGGDHDAGSEVFYGKTEVSCVRCHRIDGTGGRVGPELSGIALQKDRQYLLEAIADPNKVIAEGYTQVKVMTIDGVMHTGIVKEENDKMLVLLDSNEKEIFIDQDDIEDRRAGLSSMPDDLIKELSPKELRDLVEFLSHRKTKPAKGAGHE